MEEEKWEEAIKEDELKENVPISVKIGKKTVLLVRSDNRIHAIAGKCPHYGALLQNGLLLDHVLTCPWHNARFDITSGKMKSPPAADDLALYEVKVEDGIVYVRKAAGVAPSEKDEDREKHARKGERIFLIVGAGAAGSSAAVTLRKEGFDGRVIMLTEEGEFPYDRPNLSKDYLTGEVKREWMILKPEEFYRDLEIEVLRNYKVIGVDVNERKITFAHETQMKYDRLLVATGGIPRTPPISGTEFDGFFLLRSFADAEDILSRLDRTKRVVIIGAGFIGLESASALRKRDIEVHLVAPELVPLERVFGAMIGNRIKAEHEKSGVYFHSGVTAEEIKKNGSTARILLSDQSGIEADMIIAGIGIVPAVGFLEESGLVETGAIPVNEFLQTENENVFAAGDVAVVPDSITGEKRRIEHWVEALRQGQHVARSMLGKKSDYSEVPFFWTHQYEMEIRYVGYVKSPDMIKFRGDAAGESFVAGFYEKGRLKAAAGLGREKEIILLGEILKAGINVPAEKLADEGTDLRELLMKSREQD